MNSTKILSGCGGFHLPPREWYVDSLDIKNYYCEAPLESLNVIVALEA